MMKEAEGGAEKYAALALEHNPDSPTALNLLASIRLSQTRNDEAQSLLEQSLLKWLGKPDVKPPIYDDRISFVKLLLEVELYDKALEVLETLQREDEDNVELWYLYACAYYHNNGESNEESWKSARECGEMCLKLYERENWDDGELRAHCQAMLEEIKKSGVSYKDESEEEDGGEDEWEDTDDDVEMEDAD
jgi:tetratricopeptide (TPR) repeat protein